MSNTDKIDWARWLVSSSTTPATRFVVGTTKTTPLFRIVQHRLINSFNAASSDPQSITEYSFRPSVNSVDDYDELECRHFIYATIELQSFHGRGKEATSKKGRCTTRVFIEYHLRDWGSRSEASPLNSYTLATHWRIRSAAPVHYVIMRDGQLQLSEHWVMLSCGKTTCSAKEAFFTLQHDILLRHCLVKWSIPSAREETLRRPHSDFADKIDIGWKKNSK